MPYFLRCDGCHTETERRELGQEARQLGAELRWIVHSGDRHQCPECRAATSAQEVKKPDPAAPQPEASQLDWG